MPWLEAVDGLQVWETDAETGSIPPSLRCEGGMFITGVSVAAVDVDRFLQSLDVAVTQDDRGYVVPAAGFYCHRSTLWTAWNDHNHNTNHQVEDPKADCYLEHGLHLLPPQPPPTPPIFSGRPRLLRSATRARMVAVVTATAASDALLGPWLADNAAMRPPLLVGPNRRPLHRRKRARRILLQPQPQHGLPASVEPGDVPPDGHDPPPAVAAPES